MPSPEPAILASYDYRLVALSIIIAVLASYAALDVAGRVTSGRGGTRSAWLTGGAVAMGTGIWSMHYVGMLAFRLPVQVLYDWPTVGLSLLAAILASAIALFVVSRDKMGTVRAIIGSVFMGSAIAGMHYIGMAAMRLPALCHFSFVIVVISVVLAIVISWIALWLTFRFRGEKKSGGWQKVASAVVMGAAIPVMHYTGMAAASFTPAKMANGSLSQALHISSLGTGFNCCAISTASWPPTASPQIRKASLSRKNRTTFRMLGLLSTIRMHFWTVTLTIHQGFHISTSESVSD